MSVNEAAADKDPNSGIKVKHEASMFAKKTVYAHKTTHVYCIYGCVCVCVCLWLDVVDCCCCCCCCICFWGYQGNRKCWFRAAGVRSSRCRHCVRSFPVWQTHGATGWMDNRLPNLKCWITGNFSRHWETGGESSASDQCIFTITLSRSLVTWSRSHTNTESEMCVDIRRLPDTSPRGGIWTCDPLEISPVLQPLGHELHLDLSTKLHIQITEEESLSWTRCLNHWDRVRTEQMSCQDDLEMWWRDIWT